MTAAKNWSIRRVAGELAVDIKSDRLLPGITSGLVVGLVEVILGLSFAALIYIHELSILESLHSCKTQERPHNLATFLRPDD